uniref:Uncharacterized protein n=1 Tax=Piliocolobus tephrosceles TaxID=591936 RepID=A0A8C9IDG4_9PRIM
SLGDRARLRFKKKKRKGSRVLLCSPHYWLPDLTPDPDPSSLILLLYPDRFKHCDETGLCLCFSFFSSLIPAY